MHTTQHKLTLCLSGFLILFFELACIRWFPAYVTFLHFFSNIVLVACFLGMSVGCLLARSRTSWLARFPRLAFLCFCAALVFFVLYQNWNGLVVDVSTVEKAKAVFFGSESRSAAVAGFVIPLEVVNGLFYCLIALLFIGPGQVMGRAFNAVPQRLTAYSLNVAGSLVGIAFFSFLSSLNTPAWIWFLISFAVIAWWLFEEKALTNERIFYLIGTLALVVFPGITSYKNIHTYWSPYYLVTHKVDTGDIGVDNVGHQVMVSNHGPAAAYSVVHLLQRDSGGAPFEKVLIIGAGSGNDASHALRHNVKYIDAVEIDPVIQKIGAQFHPDQPYQDPRVAVHIQDGRRFLNITGKKYDLIIYALVDSIVLASGYSNLRLENFLFTEQALEEIKSHLSENGIFVTYNAFRQGWVVSRIARMAETVFGEPPLVMSLPPQESIDPQTLDTGLSIILSGEVRPIREAFRRRGFFWFSEQVGESLKINGFEELPFEPGTSWHKLPLAEILSGPETLPAATDDWPQLYLKYPSVPLRPYLSGMATLLIVSLLLIMWLSPVPIRKLDGRMFFLGAGFLLLETKTVVQLSLLYGSTWFVNSVVFFVILLLILLSNLLTAKATNAPIGWCYAALVTALILVYILPWDAFLSGSWLWRCGAPTILALSPLFFAGLIFARSFRRSENPDRDFASNISGAVVGACCEPLSMLWGFKGLALLAIFFYLCSVLLGKTPQGRAGI